MQNKSHILLRIEKQMFFWTVIQMFSSSIPLFSISLLCRKSWS